MKIVFLEPLGLTVEAIEKACDNLKKQGHEVVVYPDRRPELNIERAAGADIVLESNMPLRKDFFDACPNLKMLSIACWGNFLLTRLTISTTGKPPIMAIAPQLMGLMGLPANILITVRPTPQMKQAQTLAVVTPRQ